MSCTVVSDVSLIPFSSSLLSSLPFSSPLLSYSFPFYSSPPVQTPTSPTDTLL